jgi:putative oxygen-independent coproporphyrinogen III oxidase
VRNQPFGVYLHWPFCLSKCPYCDFNSHVRQSAIDQPRYAAAFAAEIAAVADRIGARTVSTIFLGGGTPSLMQPATVAAILEAVARRWTIAADAEITLEANPTSVEATRFRGFRAAGINRVSLGVQALDDTALTALGRMHTVAEAVAALGVARAVFKRTSFDLIYARVGQTLAAWEQELKRALAEADEHLSLYQLTVEAGTPFAALHAAGKLPVPDHELARLFYDLTQDLCTAAGLPAYEVSNHAQRGGECRHNLVYWRYGEYAGVGPGAHGRIEIDGVRHATATDRRPEAWLKLVETRGNGLVVDEPLTRAQMADEFLLMGLRLSEGIDPARYHALAGRALDPDRVAMLARGGLIDRSADECVRVTRAGFPVLDTVIAQLAA